MMGIIIDERHSVPITDELEPTSNSTELGEAFMNDFWRNANLGTQCRSRESVPDVMLPVQRQFDFNDVASLISE